MSSVNTLDMWLKKGKTKSDLEQSLAREVNRLLTVYRSHMDAEPMAGGCQNLMMRSEPSALLQVCRSEALFTFDSSKWRTFDAMPICIKLYILSFLGPADLCRCSGVSRQWYRLCTDELLWRRLLATESRQWQSVYDDGNPDVYRRVCSQMSSKQIYLRCHPNFRRWNFLGRVPNLWHYLVATRPKLVMFGPGLESDTSRLVRSILTDQQLKGLNDDPRFLVTGMVPGEFAGVGSGISLKLADEAFNLVTLYSNVKAVRQRLDAENRVRQNKLFEQGPAQGGRPPVHDVKPAIQELLRRSHGYVFVVDASTSFDEVALSQCELFAMLCEMWAPSGVPLLVLCCSRATRPDCSTSPSILPATDIVRALRLGRLSRKWLAQCGDVETLTGIRKGFQWLLHEASGLSFFGKAR